MTENNMTENNMTTKTRVYIVFKPVSSREYSGIEFVGVFFSRESAETWIKGHRNPSKYFIETYEQPEEGMAEEVFNCSIELSKETAYSTHSTKKGNQMNIHTAKFINLTDIATVIGEDFDDLAELVDGAFAASGDTDVALVALPKFLGLFDVDDEETVMKALRDIIGTEFVAAAEYFVNLTA